MEGLSVDNLTIHSRFRDYSVEFVADFLTPLRSWRDNNGFFLVDRKISELHKKRISKVLPPEKTILLNALEENKTLATCSEIISTLVERGVRRDTVLVAVGGGIVQDVTAFVASILYRGIDWAFFPTTLLAQADSCIGSKTSINLGKRKNLLGNFYPPLSVSIDTAFLETLSEDDIKSGIGEMLHFFYYAGSPFKDKILAAHADLLKDRNLLLEFIQESLRIKKGVIEIDELDQGERRKFNYGHSFGHAIESATNYQIKHGQAVTIGMDIANFLSWRLGLLSKEEFERTHDQWKINFPEFKLETINLETLFAALRKDKKNIGANLGCILSQGPGALLAKQIPFDQVLENTIQDYFNGRLIDASR